MTSATCGLVASVVASDRAGHGSPVMDLASLAVVPAAALVEAGAAAAGAVRRGVRWLRHCLATGLHGLANRIEATVLVPVPVATVASYPVAQVTQPATVAEVEEWPEERWTLAPVEAVILPMPVPMPSAAQVTTERPLGQQPELPGRQDVTTLAAVLAEHGSIRAAARALGIAESTFRSRVKRAGVQLPGRKAKGTVPADGEVVLVVA